MKFTLFAFVISLIGVCHCWNYANQDAWVKESPLCGGKAQSPIDIETSKVAAGVGQPVVLYNFDKTVKYTVQKSDFFYYLSFFANDPPGVNDGVKPKVNVNGKNLTVLGGAIHWGAGNEGSEHTIDGKAFAAELQLTLMDTTDPRFASSISFVSFLYELSKEDNTELKPFLDVVARLNVKDGVLPLGFVSTEFTLASLIGNVNNLDFYSYTGSMTSPVCLENIAWLISTQKSKISANQLDIIRKATGVNECRRKVQPLNNRVVTYVSAF